AGLGGAPAYGVPQVPYPMVPYAPVASSGYGMPWPMAVSGLSPQHLMASPRAPWSEAPASGGTFFTASASAASAIRSSVTGLGEEPPRSTATSPWDQPSSYSDPRKSVLR